MKRITRRGHSLRQLPRPSLRLHDQVQIPLPAPIQALHVPRPIRLALPRQGLVVVLHGEPQPRAPPEAGAEAPVVAVDLLVVEALLQGGPLLEVEVLREGRGERAGELVLVGVVGVGEGGGLGREQRGAVEDDGGAESRRGRWDGDFGGQIASACCVTKGKSAEKPS